MKIVLKTIPHRKQRYDTIGDYFIKGQKKDIHIRVSDLGNWKYELAVMIHELVELAWVKVNGIAIPLIDDFDIRFEEERKMGIHGIDDEPGDDQMAPYHPGHCFATAVERMVIAMLGASWEAYSQACETVSSTWSKRKNQSSKNA